jgi:hypothetical protein
VTLARKDGVVAMMNFAHVGCGFTVVPVSAHDEPRQASER